MSHKKYTNYSKPQTAETPEVDAPVIEEVTPEPTVVEETIGTVIDCKKLRIRKSPSSLATVLCEIPAGTKVSIELDNSTVAFYKVCTEAGVEGYCMKQFIAVV